VPPSRRTWRHGHLESKAAPGTRSEEKEPVVKVFIVGISGAVGGLLAEDLTRRGDVVSGLVRRDDQRADLASRNVEARVGDIGALTADALVPMLSRVDAVVHTAGSNGGSRDVTDAADGEGVLKALEATRRAGVTRFALVSVLPEAWRETACSTHASRSTAGAVVRPPAGRPGGTPAPPRR
jgi:NAD(P)-dependent dehydrogenase (short-subunit alcohol dehydrogenase family)